MMENKQKNRVHIKNVITDASFIFTCHVLTELAQVFFNARELWTGHASYIEEIIMFLACWAVCAWTCEARCKHLIYVTILTSFMLGGRCLLLDEIARLPEICGWLWLDAICVIWIMHDVDKWWPIKPKVSK